jgi:hypothetical protein
MHVVVCAVLSDEPAASGYCVYLVSIMHTLNRTVVPHKTGKHKIANEILQTIGHSVTNNGSFKELSQVEQ